MDSPCVLLTWETEICLGAEKILCMTDMFFMTNYASEYGLQFCSSQSVIRPRFWGPVEEYASGRQEPGLVLGLKVYPEVQQIVHLSLFPASRMAA